MALIEWDNNLSVGIPSLDDQHKQLIALLNQLNDAMKAGKARDIIATVLKEVIDYTSYHFSTEEEYMDKVNFSGTFTHKIEHKKLVEKALSLHRDVEAGKLMVTIEVMNFLQEWVTNHILGTDKKYTAAFSEQGIQ
ncbi:MAG: hemerythrin family protein [Chitinispirillaceae bacterium]|nr:hemerythrin family protein [Chitinispirillaceae bacterium]